MALFEKQIETLKRQLGGLEPSQRVALGLCVVIIAGAVLTLTQWSLEREMIPLYDDAMSEDEVASAVRQLQILGEDFETRGDDIYVRPGSRRHLIVTLNARNSGPADTSITFETLLKENDHFASAQKTQFNQNIALSNELALMIRSWTKIKDARVKIAPETRRRLNKASKPTATVQVSLNSGITMDKGIVQSLGRLVAGAVPGLEPQDVTVIDLVTGRSYFVDDPQDSYAGNLYELQRTRERELKSKIEELLSYIPGVIAEVRLNLDDQVVSSIETNLAEPAVKRESKDETTQTNQANGQEPGVSANTGSALVGRGSGGSSTKEKIETEFMENRGGTVTQTSKKAGAVLNAAASIGLPRSYFVGALKAMSGDSGPEPTTDEIDSFIEEQKAEIAKQVEPILGASSEGDADVVVSVYADRAIAFLPPSATPQEQTGSMMDFVTANGERIGLFALAMTAMGMVMLMARRGGAVQAAADETGPDHITAGPLGELFVEDGAVGKAGSPDAFLIAQETDENSIRSHQISQQVTDLIDDDPEAAAQLVRRWIERDP